MRIAVCDDEKEVRDMFAGRLHELYPDAAISLYQSGDELLLAEGQPDIEIGRASCRERVSTLV